MAAKKNTATIESASVDILQVERGTLEVCILGSSPIILNRMSEKAKRELLMPKGRKTAHDKATSLKHNPIEEWRASAYTLRSEEAPTFLAVLATSFKGAMATAALDLPGAKKAQIGRLTYVNGDYVPVYGLPQLSMSVVRSADINRTPDIRTRAIVPEWACRLSVTYIKPLMRPQAVVNLIAASGLTIGVGDWRPEKGKGNYGQFEIVSPDDKRFTAIVKAGQRDAQRKAFEVPVCYDDETSSLLAWFEDELAKRKQEGRAA
jgi:hypothetical protein